MGQALEPDAFNRRTQPCPSHVDDLLAPHFLAKLRILRNRTQCVGRVCTIGSLGGRRLAVTQAKLEAPMNLQTNPELERAFNYVRETSTSIFLTGKAGSGKTTFLRQFKAEGGKRMAVVAPTGVAAINAGGMTIHSLFQLPFGLHVPDAHRRY